MGAGAGVFVYAEYSNDDEPVPSCALFFFFFNQLHSHALSERRRRQRMQIDTKTLALRGGVHSPRATIRKAAKRNAEFPKSDNSCRFGPQNRTCGLKFREAVFPGVRTAEVPSHWHHCWPPAAGSAESFHFHIDSLMNG